MSDQATRSDAAEELRLLSKALHDLCQPLTTLQCRLEMAGMLDTEAAYREAVEHALGECCRLTAAIDSMRGVVRTAAKRAESTAI